MTYPADIEDKIGFAPIRHLLTEKCLSELGIAKCREMAFSSDREMVTRQLRQTAEMKDVILSAKPFPTSHFYDLTHHLERLRTPGSYMPEEQLFRLGRSLHTFYALIDFFRIDEDKETEYPELSVIFQSATMFGVVSSAIDSVLDRFGEVRENASPELADISRRLNAANSSVTNAIKRIADRARADGLIGRDTLPVLRDGRLVIPVNAADKRQLPGIIQDESASGKTVFIEPQEIVEINNRIKSLQAEKKREIIRILVRTADVIRPEIDNLLGVYDILAEVDFIRAKALVAIEAGGTLPCFDDSPVIEWYNAFHPALALTLRNQNKNVVPLTLRLDGKKRILIISGPNAGGKSVALKTVGVNQYIIQCGMLPSLDENSHVGLFDNLFIDIGDQQSIENDLSTYSSHLRNMKYFINRSASPELKTLILIDEMGSGTEPQIGGALAQAILARLDDQKVFAIITTHYQNIKVFAKTRGSMLNGAMLYNRERLEPLFKLSVGQPGSSFALEIAAKTGLPVQVVEAAREIVGAEYVNIDKYLMDIDRDKKYWASKRLSIKEKEKRLNDLLEQSETTAASLRQQRNEIIRNARAEAERIVKEANARIERTIREIRTAEAEKEHTRQLRAELRQYAENLGKEEVSQPAILEKSRMGRKKKTATPAPISIEVAPKPLAKGDFVKIDGLTASGEILGIEGKNAVVAFGGVKTTVALDKLVAAKKISRDVSFVRMSMSKTTSDDIREKQLRFKPEIDVRGMRADEAVQAVTYFLDDALQFNASRIRILHGTGTGALRMAIRSILSANASVRNFHDEDVRFGGAGITVVNLT